MLAAEPAGVLFGRVSAPGAPKTWIVHIRLEPSGRELVTNPDRLFVFADLPAALYRVVVSSAGFAERTVETSLASGERKEIFPALLHAESGGEAVIEQEETVTAEAVRVVGQQTLKSDDFAKAPSALIPDLARGLQMLPGVTSTSNLDARPYIEGGNPDQTLSLVDGVFIPFPFHFGGIASLLNPAAFEKADLFAAGYPAEYGQALSAVIFSDLREGGEKTHGVLNLSPVQGDGRISGPWAGGDGGWMLSGRRLTYDLLLKGLSQEKLISSGTGFVLPYFYDLESTVTRRLKDGEHDLRLSALFTEEGLQLQNVGDADVRHLHNNGFLSGRWRGPLPGSGLGEARLTYQHEQDTDRERSAAGFSDFWVWSWTVQNALKASWPVGKHVVDTGTYFEHAEMESDARQMGKVTLPLLVTHVVNHHINYTGAYAQDAFPLLDPRLSITAGIRYERFSLTDEDLFSPRVSLSWRASERRSVKAAWGLYSQYPRDVWTLAANPGLKAPKAEHFVASFEEGAGAWDTRVQAYYKNLRAIVQENFGLGGVVSGTGRAYGVELSVGRKVRSDDPIQGWIAYSYGVSQERPAGGGWTFSDYDQRHSLSVTGTFHLSPTWTLSSSFRFRSGRPYTAYVPGAVLDPATGLPVAVLIPQTRNARRMPAWHQLDLRTDKSFKTSWATLSVYLAVQNVYGQRNLYQVQYRDDGSRDDILDVPWFPLPLFGVSAEF